MGVKSCSRKGCGEIMCDTYVPEVGYVCTDCQAEFKIFLATKPLPILNELDISRALEEFMKIPKNSFNKGEEMTVSEFFNKYTS